MADLLNMLFDTHCHLTSKRLGKNLDAVIGNARSRGVEKILIPGVDLTDSQRAVDLASSYPNLYAAIGIYPGHANGSEPALESDEWKSMLHVTCVKAIGEIGLDRTHLATVSLETQSKCFRRQLQWAKETGRSVILHCREMPDELLTILNTDWDQKFSHRMVLHCCEANSKLLAFAKESGVFIGIDGDLTYDAVKQHFIREVPQDLLVLETDAPYLLPEPLRSTKAYPNEPANLHYIAESVAHLWQVSSEEVARITTANAMRLFNLT